MKKLLVIAGAFILLLAVSLYTLLFTSPGNGIVAPLIASKIKEKTSLPAVLETFELTMSTFTITLQLSENNRIETSGNYSLFTRQLDAAYRVRFDALSELQPLTQQPLQGKLGADGSVVGTAAQLRITGSSDIAQSETTYDIELLELAPAKVIATVKQLQLPALLQMAGQSAYAKGVVNADIQLDDLDPQHLEGFAHITLANGVINRATMQKAFNITLPKTTFKTQLQVKLAAKDVDYTLDFASNLARITSHGTVAPQTLASDIAYDLAIKELALFKPLTNAPLRGPLNLNGTLKGDKTSMLLKGKSDIAKSSTTLEVIVKELRPHAVTLEGKGLRLGSLLYMLEQPRYADAHIDLSVNLSDARAETLKGTVTSTISRGNADAKVIAKAFDLKNVPKITFNGTSTTVLKKRTLTSQVDLKSSLATLVLKDAKVDLAKEVTTSDYTLTLPDLERLYFLTERHLKGAITLTGDLRKDEHLLLNAHSDLLDGRIDARLLDKKLHADFASIETLKALRMLTYPEVFASSLEGKLDYDLESKKGRLDAQLHNGRFTQNEMIDLVRQFGNYNLYNERFESTLISRIHKEQTSSDLDMVAGNATIKGKDIRLNTQTRRIDAKLDVVANRNPLGVRLRGDVNAPQVDVDATKLIEKEAGKLIEKEVGKFLKGLF